MWALCALLSLLFTGIMTSAGELGDRLIRSDIVCENDIWNRECPGESVLSIETVDYKVVTGAYICNRNNSVQGNPCPSEILKTSLVKTRCNGKKQCNLPAEKSIFGNPCPGVKITASIYLEIFFACVEQPTSSPTVQPRESPSREPPTSDKTTVRAATVLKTSSPSSTTANSVDMNKSPEPRSGQTTTAKYHKPRPCTTSPRREIITFNPNNEPAINSSLLCSPQNAQVVFLSALLLAVLQFLLY